MHSRRVLSFFFATRTEAPHGEVFGLINPLSNSSCSWTLSSCNSPGAILCGVIEMGEIPWCNSTPKSMSLCGGSPDSSSGKHPNIRKPLEVDPSLISPHPLGYGSLANPSIVPDTRTHILSGAKYRACPPEIQHEYRPACWR